MPIYVPVYMPVKFESNCLPTPTTTIKYLAINVPWGTQRNNPPNAAQPSSSSYSGGYVAAASIVPPPCRRASPTHKKKGGVCSLRSLQSLRSQTLHQRLKGGWTNPSPWSGFAREKKAPTSMLSLFSLKGGIHASPPPLRHRWA